MKAAAARGHLPNWAGAPEFGLGSAQSACSFEPRLGAASRTKLVHSAAERNRGSLCHVRLHEERCPTKSRGACFSCCLSGPANSGLQDAEVIAAAWEILDNFNKNDIGRTHQPSLASPEGINALAASVVAASEAALSADGSQPLLGVCANDAQEAVTALRQWTQALSCGMVSPRMVDADNGSTVDMLLGPVYVKYNAKTRLCYVTPYQGTFRGVIIQIGQRQIGHLPLFLFQGSCFLGS